MTPRALWTGYSYQGLLAGLESRGWSNLSGHEYEWYPRCHGNLAHVPPMRPDEYGAYIERECARRDVNVLVCAKPFDSNVRATGAAMLDFWCMPPDALQRIRERGTVIVWWSLDDSNDFGFAAESGVYSHVDVACTCSDESVDWYKRFGSADSMRLWPAFDQVEWANIPNAPVACDFVMVGSTYYPKPNASFGLLRREVVQAAIDVGAKVNIWGPRAWLSAELGGSADFEPYYRGVADRSQLGSIFKAARISYSSFLRKSFGYLTDRPPIIAGAGGFNLMEAQLGLSQTFRQGEHCGWHVPGDIDDVKRQIAYWLEHEAERKAASENMQRLVLAEHTYLNRAEQLDVAVRAAMDRRAAERKRSCCT